MIRHSLRRCIVALVIGDDCDRSLMFAEICLTLVVKHLRAKLNNSNQAQILFQFNRKICSTKKT
jgi:hypothetical protein